MEKKLYQQPKTVSTLMEPQSVLCASPGIGGGPFIPTTEGSASNTGGL